MEHPQKVSGSEVCLWRGRGPEGGGVASRAGEALSWKVVGGDLTRVKSRENRDETFLHRPVLGKAETKAPLKWLGSKKSNICHAHAHLFPGERGWQAQTSKGLGAEAAELWGAVRSAWRPRVTADCCRGLKGSQGRGLTVKS